MKFFSLLFLAAIVGLSGCSSIETNGNANMRGTNTNTGFVTNSQTNAKPTIPANVTNMSPGNMTGSNSNTNGSTNSTMNRNATPR